MSLFVLALHRERIYFNCRSLIIRLPATVIVLLLSAVTLAADLPLTLADAQRLAVERSRQVSAQESALVAAQQMAVAAGQLPDPVVTVGLDSWPVDGAHRFSVGGDDFTMGRVAISQQFTRAGKRKLRAERFDREGDRTVAEKAALIASIQRDTALAWLDRHYAEAMEVLIEEEKKATTLELTAAEAAYRGGRAAQVDVISARAALAELDDRASEINQRLTTAKSALERWVGDGRALSLADAPSLEAIRVEPNMLEMELSHHPEISVLDSREELAWTDARLAEADKHADWSVALDYAQRGSGFSDFVSVSVSIPLQWDQANRQSREVAAKLALAEQAGAERDETLRREVGEVRAQVQAWQSGRERLGRYAREIIPLAQARSEATLAAYAAGKSSSGDVLRARRDEIDVRLRALELESSTARLWAQLNFLFPDDEAGPEAHSLCV
jgi:outer membrane protein TolC